MLSKSLLSLALAADVASAFPWVALQAGVDTSLLSHEKRQQTGTGPGSAAQCAFNPVHKGAAPLVAPYWYNNATNGLPGNGVGGYLVPAKGDVAHYFVAPNYTTDIRGPCPGLNAAANHNVSLFFKVSNSSCPLTPFQFLSHDGITTFNELVDAQQNIYNVGYDLAQLLAVLGLTVTDGDIATEKLSIGCDATTRTSINPTLTGSEPGLDGHDKFEADTSLTRNDYFLADGDNFSFNGTLFQMMTATTKANYNLKNLALYRYQRYQQSLAENQNFYFGPFSLLLYGAASFLYELMPSGTRNYAPDYYTISSFFGAHKNKNGTYSFTGKERIPANWTNRVEPYTNLLVVEQILAMYALHPVLFGGNTGSGQFDVISTDNGITNGTLTATSPTDVLCLLYQLTTERFPSSLNSILTPTVAAVQFAVSKLGPAYDNLGCSVPLTR